MEEPVYSYHYEGGLITDPCACVEGYCTLCVCPLFFSAALAAMIVKCGHCTVVITVYPQYSKILERRSQGCRRYGGKKLSVH